MNLRERDCVQFILTDSNHPAHCSYSSVNLVLLYEFRGYPVHDGRCAVDDIVMMVFASMQIMTAYEADCVAIHVP